MSIFKIPTGIILLFFLVSSCDFSQKQANKNSHIIEAEELNLNNYQIDSDSSNTFIRLTSETGSAVYNFALPSGYYNIDVRYLSESVGQNTYAMYINENQIVAWLGKDQDDKWHKLSEQKWHVPNHIEINRGDEIRIESLSENGSMVIFDYIKFTESNPLKSASDTSTEISSAQNMPDEIVKSIDDYITIYPKEYNKAIKNPLKGFRPYTINHEYGTLIKNYFKWNDLENDASDGVTKIINVSNERWKDIEKKNVKIIPRVYLEWPGQENSWAEDMTPGDYTSEQFKKRVTGLIKKLGEAWDNDPRVAYVEMGLIGQWGEMEYPDTKDDIKEAIAAQFNESFKNKLIMIRWPNTYNDHIFNFGYYWDSFAHHDQEYYAYHLGKTSPRWKTAVIGGEVAYNWGNDSIQPGISPDVSLKEPVHRNYIIDRIRRLHTNHLGWISKYHQNNESVKAGAELMQKAFGYRFILSEVTYPKKINTDSGFVVSFKVKNTGSSPFYYNWPIEISLLDTESKGVVWKKQYTDVDIRKWLPGDRWDDAEDIYTIPAETYVVNQNLHISDVPKGTYILALAILDPAGNQPSARFAIKNYYKGGRHPIGRVGVDSSIDNYPLSEFYDIQSDTSLHYVVNK